MGDEARCADWHPKMPTGGRKESEAAEHDTTTARGGRGGEGEGRLG